MGERGPEKGHAYGAAAISKCLHGAHFPISKRDIISKYGSCKVEFRKGETMNLKKVFEDIPDETFYSPVDVEKAISENM